MNVKNLALLLAAALPLLFGTTHSASATLGGSLSLANLSVSPNPVVAGGNVIISFRLYNSFSFWIFSVYLQPSAAYPILNISPLNGYSIVQLNQGLNRTYYNFTIPIPATTPSGTYRVFFNATYYVLGSTGVTVTGSSMPVSFYVQNRPAIRVLAAAPQPAALYSGYNQNVSLLIQNAGYGNARNVSVAVSTKPGLNILSSVNTFFASNLTQGSSVTVPLQVSAQNVSRAIIVANVTYYSSNLAQRFSSTQSVNLSVAPAAQFRIGSQKSNVNPGSTDVPISFNIMNAGTSDAQQVMVSLQSTYPITPVASSAYISDLPPGASTNVTFLVSIDSQGVPGNYPVTLYEQWKQPNGAINQQFSGSSNYYAMVVGGAAVSSLIVYAAIAIVILGVLLMIRKNMAKRTAKRKA